MENIEGIWQAYHARLQAFIRGRVGDAADADDILQDVFVRIHARIDTLQDTGKLQSWIYQIARNAVIDHYRTRKTAEQLPASLTSAEADPDDGPLEDLNGCVLAMVRQLPDHYREAVTLSEIEGLSQKEVAARQGVSLSGAKTRVQRGRARMKEMLLDCCRFEFDRRGQVIDYERGPQCDCDTSCDQS
jgi:RNA polymerase sigma-70 factor (ECF subfamily)